MLLLFGFANAGVPFEQIGPGTFYVLAGLLLGKPIGILFFSRVAHLAGGSLPPGLRTADLLAVGVVASIGFTVSLFFATAAFPGGAALAQTKMGALLSFVAAPLALLLRLVPAEKEGIRGKVGNVAADNETSGEFTTTVPTGNRVNSQENAQPLVKHMWNTSRAWVRW